MMTGLLQDVRYAARVLINAPGFTLTAVVTLALGIGANVAMFSVVHAVLLAPLPYREPQRLVLVRAEADYVGASRPVPVTVSSAELASWQRSFDAISAPAFYATNVDALATDSGSEILDSAIVSDGFFQTMAGPLAAGRPLQTGDDGLPVVVVSERLAVRQFGSSEQAVGQNLILTPQSYTVVGVAGRAFQFPVPKTDVWRPAGFARATNPRCCGFRAVARLEAGATLERAAASVRPMFDRPATATGSAGSYVRTSVVRLTDDLVSNVRPALLVLFAAVTLVLLVACSNLVNLLLARNAARQREFGVRRALGAPAGRVVRQLLVESAVLVTAGTVVGTLLAGPILVALTRLAGDAVPRIEAIHIDRLALVFAACLAALATVATGTLPALRAVSDSAVPIQGWGRASTPRSTRRWQRAMCIVQVALAVMLLVGATLLGRSLARLLNVDLGVSTDRVLTTSLNLAFGTRPSDAQTVARIDRLIESIRPLPGVSAVGVGTSLPPNVSRMRVTLKRTGDSVDYQASAVPVTPGYFSALQMRLIKGRFFTSTDDDRHPPVMIMSEGTAARFFGATDSLGRTMSLPVLRDGKVVSVTMTLVGITANVKYAGLTAPPDDIVYRPFAQQPWMSPFLVVRTSGDPADFAPTLRRTITEVDKGIVTSSLTTLDQLVGEATAQPQFRTVLLASLAALALGIAAIGLYGVVAYAVSQRAKEIGIRIALGATSRDMLMMVLREGVIVAVTGIVTGTAGALVLGRILAGLLYGVTPTDPVSFLAAGAGLLGVTLLASYLPARRASRIDPIRALRAE